VIVGGVGTVGDAEMVQAISEGVANGIKKSQTGGVGVPKDHGSLNAVSPSNWNLKQWKFSSAIRVWRNSARLLLVFLEWNAGKVFFYLNLIVFLTFVLLGVFRHGWKM
jgi:hypothetical protein